MTPMPATRVPIAPAPKPRAWLVVIWLCVLAAAGYGGYRVYPIVKARLADRAKPAGPPMNRAAPVVTGESRLGDLPIYLNGLGNVTAFNTVTLRSRVDGQIVKVAFTEGQMVHEGDLIVQIDPRPFEVQRDQALGQLAKDQASLKNAELDLARYRIAGKAVSQQQLDTAIAAVAQYEGAVKTDEAQVAAANLQLAYCRITAPISGRIGLRGVDIGNLVRANDPSGLAVITQLQPIAVIFYLPQDSLPQVLKAAAQGGLVAEAYSSDMKTLLATGTLAAVDNQIDSNTGTARLKAVFENKDGMLFPNQFVNVRLLVETREKVVLVPAAAVQRSPQTMYVYVVKHDDTVEMRPVTAGPTEGELTLIEAGLRPNETVVTDGVDKLQPGAKVVVRGTASQPATAPAGAATPPAATSRPVITSLPAPGLQRPGASHPRRRR